MSVVEAVQSRFAGRDVRALLAGGRSTWGTADVRVLAGLAALAVVFPLVIGAATGTLAVPRNDDWSYRGPAMLLHQTGRLEIDGAAQAMLVGQILFVQPLLWLSGGSWWAFLVAGILFDVGAVGAAYALARQLLGRPHAALAAALVPLFPGYLPYAVSFMTDVPAAAAQWAALGAGLAALQRRPIDGRLLAFALLLGCLGFTVREFAVVAPASIVVTVLIAEPRRARHWLAAGAVGAFVVALRWWRIELPGAAGSFPPVPGVERQLVPAATTVAFVLAPVALIAAVRWARVWRWRDVALGAALAIVLLLVRGQLRLDQMLLDNLMSPWGVPAREYLIGGRPRLFSQPVWLAIGAAALVAFVLFGGLLGGIAGTLVRQARPRASTLAGWIGSPPGLLVVFIAGLALGLAVFGTYRWLYDRYLWALIPPLAVLLLLPPPAVAPRAADGATTAPPRFPPIAVFPPVTIRLPTAERILAGGLALSIGGLLALSTIFLFNAAAFDGARWRAAEGLVARGYAPEQIDAGPEWVGSHQAGRATAANPVPGARVWWQGWWPDFRMCAFVSSTAQTEGRFRLLEVLERAYKLDLVFGAWKPLYLYAVDDPACPTAGATAPPAADRT